MFSKKLFLSVLFVSAIIIFPFTVSGAPGSISPYTFSANFSLVSAGLNYLSGADYWAYIRPGDQLYVITPFFIEYSYDKVHDTFFDGDFFYSFPAPGTGGPGPYGQSIGGGGPRDPDEFGTYAVWCERDDNQPLESRTSVQVAGGGLYDAISLTPSISMSGGGKTVAAGETIILRNQDIVSGNIPCSGFATFEVQKYCTKDAECGDNTPYRRCDTNGDVATLYRGCLGDGTCGEKPYTPVEPCKSKPSGDWAGPYYCAYNPATTYTNVMRDKLVNVCVQPENGNAFCDEVKEPELQQECMGQGSRYCNNSGNVSVDIIKCVSDQYPERGSCLQTKETVETCGGCELIGVGCGFSCEPCNPHPPAEGWEECQRNNGQKCEKTNALTDYFRCTTCSNGACGAPYITSSPGLDCGEPQDVCIPGPNFDYCITTGGCKGGGELLGQPPAEGNFAGCGYNIDICMSCGNHGGGDGGDDGGGDDGGDGGCSRITGCDDSTELHSTCDPILHACVISSNPNDTCDIIACGGGDTYSTCDTSTRTCVASNDPDDSCNVETCGEVTSSTCDTSTNTCVASNNPDDSCNIKTCGIISSSTCDTSTNTCVASNNPDDNCDVTACSGGTYSTCDTNTRTCVYSSDPNDTCDIETCGAEPSSICDTSTRTCVASSDSDDSCDLVACSGGAYSICNTNTNTCVASNNPDDNCDVTACSGGTYSTCDTSTRTCVASSDSDDVCDVVECSGGAYSICDTSTRTCVYSSDPNDNCDVTACSGGTYSTCDTSTRTCVASNNPNDNCDVTACSEDENTPPIVVGLQADDGPYCTGIPGAGIAKFSWRYSDDYGDQQSFSL
ncbi:MAG: hypothetical protein Q8Q48_02945, partial [Candidatus Staskawiczbacteria bacterium]|nr:hypothetical protein [Candidatus Staskawiczbacteria bacterium]